jgi:hypothetical protein
MKKIYLYLFLLGSISAAHAQNIFSGGRSDGFSFQTAGFGIFSGGTGNGFMVASTGTPAPLPVAYLGFTAQPQGSQALLRWQTATENSNDHFEVLHSADAAAFSFLTSVPGVGFSSLQQDYRAIDPSPYPGLNYYRLRQVDKDGSFQYSKIISVDMPKNNPGFSIKVYPNPAVQEISITLTSPREQSSLFCLYNAEGRLVDKQYRWLSAGLNLFTWNISHLSVGIYYCKIGNSDLPVASFMKE